MSTSRVTELRYEKTDEKGMFKTLTEPVFTCICLLVKQQTVLSEKRNL